MKEFLKGYIKIISYTVIGLVFMISSFYLFINYFHSKEISEGIYVTNLDTKYTEYKSNLLEISNNLNSYKARSTNNKNDKLNSLYSKLLTCNGVMVDEGTLATLKTERVLGYYDLYQLGSKFQSSLLNICWAIQLSYVTEEDNPNLGDLKLMGPYIQNSMNLINNQVSNALNSLQANSSYHYSTEITSLTIRHELGVDYDMIAGSYVDFSKIILELSRYLNSYQVIDGEVS